MVDFLRVIFGLWYLWVLLLVIIVFSVFKPIIKGFFGEKTIAAFLLTLPIDKYIILNNIMLKTDGGTTQIDHIVVSVYGIFVIETKNYKGWIFGKETDEYWVQNIYGKKNRFMNPIRQNFAHLKALEALLTDYPGIKIIPIVAFSWDCDLKVKVKSAVTYFSGVTRIIRNETQLIMPFEEARRIADLISGANIDSAENRKEHVAGIKTKVEVVANAIENDTCPKCGGKLVLRNGKYGQFKGCSNFPRCKYILK
jgi:hypothetical protein